MRSGRASLAPSAAPGPHPSTAEWARLKKVPIVALYLFEKVRTSTAIAAFMSVSALISLEETTGLNGKCNFPWGRRACALSSGSPEPLLVGWTS